MSEKTNFSRRTMLSLTAAGLVGSSTAIAKRASTSDDAVLADYDADTSVNRDASAWPQSRFDNGNTNHNPHASAPEGSLAEVWADDRPSQNPIVSDDTVLFFHTDDSGDKSLYALDADDGAERWSVGVEDENYRSDVAVAGGVVYVSINGIAGSYDTDKNELDIVSEGTTHALDIEDGAKLWSADVGGYTPKVTDEFVIVAGDTGAAAIAREDGSVLWNRDFSVTGVYAVGHGTAYVSDEYEGVLYSIDIQTGETRWERDFGTFAHLVATKHDLVASAYDTLYVLEPETGETRWKRTFEEPESKDDSSSWLGIGLPTVVADGTIYLDQYGFRAFDAETGDERVLGEGSYHTNSAVGNELCELQNTSDGQLQLVWRDLESFEIVRRQTIAVRSKHYYSSVVVTESTVYATVRSSNGEKLVVYRPAKEDDDSVDDDGSGDGDDNDSVDDDDC